MYNLQDVLYTLSSFSHLKSQLTTYTRPLYNENYQCRSLWRVLGQELQELSPKWCRDEDFKLYLKLLDNILSTSLKYAFSRIIYISEPWSVSPCIRRRW